MKNYHLKTLKISIEIFVKFKVKDQGKRIQELLPKIKNSWRKSICLHSFLLFLFLFLLLLFSQFQPFCSFEFLLWSPGLTVITWYLYSATSSLVHPFGMMKLLSLVKCGRHLHLLSPVNLPLQLRPICAMKAWLHSSFPPSQQQPLNANASPHNISYAVSVPVSVPVSQPAAAEECVCIRGGGGLTRRRDGEEEARAVMAR